MIRKLIDYLPPVIRNVREYQAIMNDGEQGEVSAVWDAVDAAFNDQFVNSATVNGVIRWENILGIKPKGTDTLDSRKFRILSRMNEQLPFTLPALKNMLQTLCGEGNYSISLDNNEYTIYLTVHMGGYGNLEDLYNLLQKVVPCNIVTTIDNVLFGISQSTAFHGAAIANGLHYTLTSNLDERYSVLSDTKGVSVIVDGSHITV